MKPELALVLACCRWPDGPARRGAIVAAAGQVHDWPAAAALAGAHRVEGLVDHGLTAAGVRVPAEVRGQIAGAAQSIRALALRDSAEMLRIAGRLDAGRIPHRFLKGVPLGIAAFGTPSLKWSWDIDLLVDPGDAVAAAAILDGLGYHPTWPRRRLDAREFERWSRVAREAEMRSDRGTTVELHWRLADHPLLLPKIGVHGPCRRVALISGHDVATLDDAANLAFLAVHGAAHGWSRLKWLADFAALLAGWEPAQRRQLCAEARRHSAGRAVDLGLALSARLLALSLADEEQRLSESDPAVKKLTELAMIVISRRRANQDIESDRRARMAIGRTQWLLMRGAAYRFKDALRRARGALDRDEYPLPYGLYWLYWLIRPFTAAGRTLRRMERAKR